MYNPKFISDFEIPLPQLNDELKASAFQNGDPVHHSRFSLAFSENRNFAIYTAHNIDGATLIPEGQWKRKNPFKNGPKNSPVKFKWIIIKDTKITLGIEVI